MQPAIAVDERVSVHESKRDRRRAEHRINSAGESSMLVFDDTTEQPFEILGSRADMLRAGLLGLSIVSPDEPALCAEPKLYESRITNHDALKPFQLVNRDRTSSSLANGAGPARSASARRAFTLDGK
jgi:hypothetical protein